MVTKSDMFSKFGHIYPARWLPVLDGNYLDNKDAFVPVNPFSEEGITLFNAVPMIFGNTNSEGRLITANLESEKKDFTDVEPEIDSFIIETVFGRYGIMRSNTFLVSRNSQTFLYKQRNT